LRGSRDLLVSEAGWAELASEIPCAHSVDLPGAGHLACITHCEQIAYQVQRFAKQERLLAKY
jgi:pimeloyl-ACP methyl ester carboxylesterase